MTPHRFRSLTVLLLTPLALFAQTAPVTPAKPATPAPAAPVAAPATEEPAKLAAFEVTGSRIRLNAGEAPAVPVFTLDRIQLEELGVNRLADIRQAIPQLAPAVGFNDNLANGGPSRGQQVSTSFNLRGLGGNSTLMLIDGHRVPHSGQEAPGGAGGREDFNVDGIPVSAIERVEVLPQGASAVYGSEAIGGVVNIILKKNYTGAELSLNYDNTFDKDVGDTSISLTAGFARGKLKTFLTASWEHQNALMSRDRWFSATSDSTVFGAAAQPAFFLQQPPVGAGLIASTNSPQNAGQANLPGLTSNFVIVPAGSRGNSALADYTTGAYPTRFDPANYSTSIDPARRRSFVVKGDYGYAAWLQPYVEARWSRFENYFTSTPITLTQSLPAGYAGNPFGQAVFVRKVFWDLPVPQMNSYQENVGLVLGVRGDLTSGFLRNWRYDLSASFARNIIFDDQIAAGFNFTLLTAAINNTDPTKRPLLAYDSTRGDPNSAGLMAGLTPTFDHRDVTDVDQYAFQADGPIWSGWAGDVKGAFGGEATQEKVHFHRDLGDSSLGFALTKPFGRRTTAAFVEVSLPLLSTRQHVPGVHRLEVSGAVRAEHFSDIGGHNTPQYTGLFQPLKWITLRTSRAEGFKTPKLYDLLAPVTRNTATLTATSNVRDTLRGGELVLGVVDSVSGGQPNLKAETSVSKTGGLVIDVPGKWFQGLSLSVDYWQTYYVNKIGAPSRQVAIDFFPERVFRGAKLAGDPANYAGVITGFDTSNINLASQKARGVDYELSYRRRFAFGQLSSAMAYSNPVPVITQSTPAAAPTSTFGQLPWRMSGSLFWSRDAWSAGTTMSYQARYYISGLTSPNAAYPSLILWNPQVAYNFAKNPAFGEKAGTWWARALAGGRVSVTVPNVFDREPSLADALNGRVVMDPRLRRYIVSFTKKL
jgi:iron complex outermembrane receptor protein